MHIVIPVAVVIGLVPVLFALTGEGLFRALSLFCAGLMLFGLVAPPAAVVAWCAAMVFAAAGRRTYLRRVAHDELEKLRAREDAKRLKIVERSSRPPRLRRPFRKRD